MGTPLMLMNCSLGHAPSMLVPLLAPACRPGCGPPGAAFQGRKVPGYETTEPSLTSALGTSRGACINAPGVRRRLCERRWSSSNGRWHLSCAKSTSMIKSDIAWTLCTMLTAAHCVSGLAVDSSANQKLAQLRLSAPSSQNARLWPRYYAPPSPPTDNKYFIVFLGTYPATPQSLSVRHPDAPWNNPTCERIHAGLNYTDAQRVGIVDLVEWYQPNREFTIHLS